MGKLITPDYAQVALLPRSVEDWIGPEHPARYVRQYVDVLKRRVPALRDVPESLEGRPQYANSMLMAIWIYGYLAGVRSSRKLARACGELVPIMWLAGTHRPDHTTLWRFWKRNHKLIRKSFLALVNVSMEQSLIGLVLQAIDGTKIRAASSTAHAMNREDVERLLAQLTAKIERLEQEIERAGAGTEEAQQAEVSKQKAAEIKARFEENIDSWTTKKQHEQEPEAVMMKGAGLAYNAQIVVDDKAGLIVTQAVVTDANDQKQLNPMLDATCEQLGRVADETVADGGYNNAEAIGTAAEKGYSILMNRSSHEASARSNPYHALNFRYDAASNTVICPQEKALTFEREVTRKRQSYRVRIFRGRECANCPVRSLCTKDRRGRSIEITAHEEQLQAHRTKFADPEKRQLLRRRMTLAERPFATIKHNLGIRRFRTRGLENVRTEWAFICMVHNIKTLIHHQMRLKMETLRVVLRQFTRTVAQRRFSHTALAH